MQGLRTGKGLGLGAALQCGLCWDGTDISSKVPQQGNRDGQLILHLRSHLPSTTFFCGHHAAVVYLLWPQHPTFYVGVMEGSIVIVSIVFGLSWLQWATLWHLEKGGGSQTANSHQKSSGKMSSSGSLLLVQRGWGNRPFSLICQCLGAPVCHGRVCLAYSNNTATIGATKGFSWGDISWLQQAWPIALTGLPPSGA